MHQIQIGCEAYIVRSGKILLGQRGPKAKGLPSWRGTWALPGGHLRFMEEPVDCIIREIKEELDIAVTRNDISFATITNDPRPETDQHYIHITYRVNIGEQEPKLNEPAMCQEWRWFPESKLPPNVFPPHRKILSAQ